MNRPGIHEAMALAHLIALGGRLDFTTLRLPPDRESCAECKQQIPPGRPGRRCAECRAKQPKKQGS